MTTGTTEPGAAGQGPGLAGAALVIAVAGTFALAVLVPLLATARDPRASSAGVSAGARADVPSEALAAYRDAASSWDIDWAILAAVGRVECGHGRSWPDAAHSAARYLRSLGIARDPEEALYGHNPSRSYVEDVLSIADTYAPPRHHRTAPPTYRAIRRWPLSKASPSTPALPTG